MRLIAESLTAAAFAPFGQVAASPARGDLVLGPDENRRPGVALVVRWVSAPAQNLPLATQIMERHRHSSQTFVPCEPDARWLLFVAPNSAAGGPDLDRARAFVVGGDQAITYAADTWHHPVCALDADARFVVATHLDGGPEDTEFVELPHAVEIVAAG